MDINTFEKLGRRISDTRYGSTIKKPKKQKKFWLIYLINQNDETTASLYAWTDIKELYERFTNERNMDLFIVKKYEYNADLSFSLAINSQGSYLEVVKGRTKDYEHKIVPIDLVMTMNEKLSIIKEYTYFIYQDIWNYVKTEPDLFNDDLLKSLKKIKYNYLYKIFSDDTKLNNDSAKFYSTVNMDLLSVFIHFYGKTLKEVK